ncbi:MAG: replication initiator protein A [Clostridia bacterium]|nr:replication initiator protein A [Clostridia bacterium]
MIERTYRVSDVVNEEFLRFPLTLLANPKYREMSLEAKFIYSLLLNRLTLSQKNNWINEDNEVYLIYTREDAANTLNITYRKAISAFKELIEAGLLFEQRQGRGFPNLLYVLKAELADEDALEFEEKFNGSDDENDEKEPANPVNMQTCSFRISITAIMAYQELQDLHIKTCRICTLKRLIIKILKISILRIVSQSISLIETLVV